jgi:hypothetical protein
MNVLDFQRRVLYDLKRQYGQHVDIVDQQVGTPDLKAGTRNTVQVATSVPLAIVLTPKAFTKGFYDTPLLKAGRQFAYGSFVDINTKIVVLDIADLPIGFEVKQSQHLIIANKRYEVESFATLEYDNGYIINCKRAEGVQNEAIHQRACFDVFKIVQSISFTLN